MSDLQTITDQMGREVTFSFPPKRIISLVPSQTEFLLDVGVPLVGRTKFCIHPQEVVNDIAVVGGTKSFRVEKIRELDADLIIGNKEENYKDGILELSRDFPVWMSDIYTLEDAYHMMNSLGTLCQKEEEASKIVLECQYAMDAVKGRFSGKVLYLIWRNPWITAGKNTFIDHLLHFLGYENQTKEERYPEFTSEQVLDLNPDKILLSSEPFPFKNTHLEEAKSKWPTTNCQLVDGELFSWYGSRLRKWKKCADLY